MSEKGNPYENALAKSFIATLKKEEVNLGEYEDMNETLSRIGYFIEGFYNKKRLQLSLGYQSSAEFEKKFKEGVLI
jgi:transposase InsO family protein